MIFCLKWDAKKMTAVPFAKIPQRWQFWSCHVISSVWKSVTDLLKNTLLITGKYNLLKITAPGLRSEPHSTEYLLQ